MLFNYDLKRQQTSTTNNNNIFLVFSCGLVPLTSPIASIAFNSLTLLTLFPILFLTTLLHVTSTCPISLL